MSQKQKRRSNSVENQPALNEEGFESNKMFKSASNQNLRKTNSVFKGFKGKSSVLNRPGTIAALSSLSQGGFSQNISANTLRNHHPQWSFSKGNRFKNLKIDNSAKMLLLPSTLNVKTSTFGFGDRNGLKQIYGKDSPPPTLYRSRSQFDYKPGAGRSIGQSYAVYQKVHMPGLNTRNEEIPGPGAYEQKTMLGANSRKFSLKSRIKPADSATRDNPPPNSYTPNYSPAEQSRFSKVTFGFGGRPNVTGKISENPGPGTYRIPSVFDKFKRIPNSALLKTLAKYRKSTRRKISKPAITARSDAEEFDDQEAIGHRGELPAPLAIKGTEEFEAHHEQNSVTSDGGQAA